MQNGDKVISPPKSYKLGHFQKKCLKDKIKLDIKYIEIRVFLIVLSTKKQVNASEFRYCPKYNVH